MGNPREKMVSLMLKRTGKKVAFKDLNIGQPFFHHGTFWVRTNYDGATDLATDYGSCAMPERVDEVRVMTEWSPSYRWADKPRD